MLTVAEALGWIERTIGAATPQTRELTEAWGHVLAEPIVATNDSPPFDKSMMDGFAVAVCDTAVPGTILPVLERVMAGQVPQQELRPGQAIQVMTGAPIPRGAEAVVPIEQVQELPEETIRLQTAAVPFGRHILRQGDSMRIGDEVLAPGQRLQFPHIGLLAELGRSPVSVFPKPTVSVLATGDELVTFAETPGPGQIRNSNEPMLLAQIQAAGVSPRPLGIAGDQREPLREKMLAGLESDFLLLTGGVSAGVLDLVPQVLEECGVTEVFHKVSLKPGKPIWFGQSAPNAAGKRTYVFGLPGNPVSTLVCFELFVKPALRRWQGASPAIYPPQQAEMTQPHLVKGDRPVYHPVRSTVRAGKLQVTPVTWGGSGDLRGTASADGMILLEPRAARYEPGEAVSFWSWGTAD